ncbi:MAG: hypothetical protein R2745_02110 [Vicinamibacterales bacterium]
MPVIKARTRGKHIVRHIARLDRENLETLFAYATFLGEPSDYVLNQVIDTLLARDKEFSAWREQHPGPHAPHPLLSHAKRRVGSGAQVVGDHASSTVLGAGTPLAG